MHRALDKFAIKSCLQYHALTVYMQQTYKQLEKIRCEKKTLKKKYDFVWCGKLLAKWYSHDRTNGNKWLRADELMKIIGTKSSGKIYNMIHHLRNIGAIEQDIYKKNARVSIYKLRINKIREVT